MGHYAFYRHFIFNVFRLNFFSKSWHRTACLERVTLNYTSRRPIDVLYKFIEYNQCCFHYYLGRGDGGNQLNHVEPEGITTKEPGAILLFHGLQIEPLAYFDPNNFP